MKAPRWDAIDPAEFDIVEFDFSLYARGIAIESVSMEVALERGTDADKHLMLVGSPVVQGALVVQRVRGRVDGAVYKVRATASLADERVHVLAGILPCETK